jgi:hypothetical protein
VVKVRCAFIKAMRAKKAKNGFGPLMSFVNQALAHGQARRRFQDGG